MATRLRRMSIDKVSLVDRGAHQEADVLLFKRDDSDDFDVIDDAADLALLGDNTTDESELDKMDPSSGDVHVNVPMGGTKKRRLVVKKKTPDAEVVDEDDDAKAAMRKSAQGADIDSFLADAPEEVRKYVEELEDTVIAVVADAVRPEEKSVQKTDTTKVDKSDDTVDDDVETDDVETDDTAGTEVAKKSKKIVKVKKAKAGPDDDEDEDDGTDVSKADTEDVFKGLDPRVVEHIRKMESDTADAQKIAKAERDQRLTSERIAKAETLVLPIDNTETVALLKALDESGSEELRTAVDGLLTKVSNAYKDSGIFTEVGTGAPGSTDTDSSIEKIAKAAREADPTLTPEQALAKAYDENPSLYDDYLSGK